jgi:hypothetical protein
MKFWVAVLGVVGMGFGMATAQVSARTAPATVAACGVMSQNFKVHSGAAPGSAARVPEGKAMVYVVEDIVQIPLNTPTLRVGMDGKWVGATRSHTYLGLAVDPGVHHLCVSVQGFTVETLENGITLHRLEVQAGKTYYVRMRETMSRNPSLDFVDVVDEDEGQLLLQTSVPAVWRAK